MGELLFELVIALIAVGMFGMTFGFRESLIDQSGGPALFPRIVILLLLIFLAVRGIVIRKNREEQEKPFHFLEMFQGSRLIYVVLLTAYAGMVKPVGFLLSTWVFSLIAIPFLYKQQYGKGMTLRRQAVTSAVTVVSVFLLYYVFTRYFHVLLPAGLLHI